MNNDCGKCQICEASTSQLRHFFVMTHKVKRSERLCCTALACGMCWEKMELIRKLMIRATLFALLPLLVLGPLAFFAESSIPNWLRYGGTTVTLASLCSLGLLWIERWRLLRGTDAARIALEAPSNPGVRESLFLIPKPTDGVNRF